MILEFFTSMERHVHTRPLKISDLMIHQLPSKLTSCFFLFFFSVCSEQAVKTKLAKTK